MKPNWLYYILLLSFILSFAACSTTRKVPSGSYLLKKNEIKLADKKIEYGSELKELIIQQPNKKLVFIKFKLLFHSMSKNDSSFFARIGEPPVIFDKNLSVSSSSQIEKYLHSVGYFDSKVDFYIDTVAKKKVIPVYKINTGKPYKVRDISLSADDAVINSLLLSWNDNSLLKKNTIYNEDVLKNERERLTLNMQNKGYYKFTKNYIFYQVDSSIGNNQVDLKLIVKNPSAVVDDSIITVNHQRYKIENVYIRTNYSPTRVRDSARVKLDTVLFVNKQYRSTKENKYHFIYRNTLRIKPQRLTPGIFVSTDDYFSVRDVERTYLGIRDFNLFQFININFTEKAGFDADSIDRLLDCYINLNRKKSNSWAPSLEINNSTITDAPDNSSGTNLGIEFSMLYRNNNLFRGAENLSVRFKTLLEKSFFAGGASLKKQFFDTYEMGGEVSLAFPRFLFPIKHDKLPKYFRPKTTLSFGGDYQYRPHFVRTIVSSSVGYYLKPNRSYEHYLFPLGLNVIKIHPDSTFNAFLSSTGDRRFQDQYSNKFIMDFRYSFFYSTQNPNKMKDFWAFRFTVESAGNLLNLISYATNSIKNEEGRYALNGLEFAQYLRSDFDLKKYFIFNKSNSCIFRFVGGLGYAYNNSSALPYERSFFGGGTNGLRGWRYRKLGPGGFNPESVNGISSSIDRTGDMILSVNIEDRFLIYKYFEGAIFTDIGNVWLLKPNSTFPYGEFKFDRFYRQLAWDVGIGLRVNLSFFVLRLDIALPVTQPQNKQGNRFVIQQSKLKDVLVNFGIGYPF